MRFSAPAPGSAPTPQRSGSLDAEAAASPAGSPVDRRGLLSLPRGRGLGRGTSDEERRSTSCARGRRSRISSMGIYRVNRLARLQRLYGLERALREHQPLSQLFQRLAATRHEIRIEHARCLCEFAAVVDGSVTRIHLLTPILENPDAGGAAPGPCCGSWAWARPSVSGVSPSTDLPFTEGCPDVQHRSI